MARQKKPGPPRTTGPGKAVGLRCHEDFLKQVDTWRANQPGLPTRPQAIIQLAELGLSHSPNRGRLSHTARAHASTMAAEVVEQLNDLSAPEGEQQKRKRRLIHGPREFREIRQDQHRERVPGSKAKR
jgi:hypothetical protein